MIKSKRVRNGTVKISKYFSCRFYKYNDVEHKKSIVGKLEEIIKLFSQANEFVKDDEVTR